MYGAVVRGDLNTVSIGTATTIGDRAVVSTTRSVEGHVSAATSIGNHVLVGPGALLQSCTVEHGAVIGAGAIVMEGAVVEATAVVEDGAVVHPGRRIPAGQVWGGNPAAFVRDLEKGELASVEDHATVSEALRTCSCPGENMSATWFRSRAGGVGAGCCACARVPAVHHSIPAGRGTRSGRQARAGDQ
jgi:carbonic anhydrase/acetyltransferase-like protein (isoleucine patch superfamily)